LLTHIKSAILFLAIAGVSASAAQAANLTSKEIAVCPTLRVCVDIIRRHEASEFDYEVLEKQFRRFGPSGRKALFDVLDTKAGNPDIARMISLIGPLSASERASIKRSWSQETAPSYLPLLLDGHPSSRDLLLLSLGSEKAFVRESARRALLRLPKSAETQPIPNNLRGPLLAALAHDPIAAGAPYLAKLNAEGHEEKFAELLGSAETDVVSSAYNALYRNSPSQAFKALLTQMGRARSPEQSQAIGDMLMRRHAQRGDGFYLKFARDISGDKTRPISARATGLHAVLISEENTVPEFTPERAAALEFLVRAQPLMTQEKYLPYLKRAKADSEMAMIWNIAQQEKWINRDHISEFYKGEKLESKVIGDLIQSDDLRSFRAGIKRAAPVHQSLLRAKMDHAVKAIGDLARQKLGLSSDRAPNAPCIISQFDAKDVLNQMPFFDFAWMTTENETRVSLDRKFLTTAHPSKLGWLAGYNIETAKPRPVHIGGALVHFNNKTGGFEQVGDFSGPVNILPDRSLKLGQTTDRFWIIDKWGGESLGVSAYWLDLSGKAAKITHRGALPDTAHGFSVAPNGDLLIRFEDKKQAPLRLTQHGDLSLACRAVRGTPKRSAPN